MRPFMQFRLWCRQAAGGERLAAGLAGLLLVALAAWALVPSKTGPGGGGLLTAGTGQVSGSQAAGSRSGGSTVGSGSSALSAPSGSNDNGLTNGGPGSGGAIGAAAGSPGQGQPAPTGTTSGPTGPGANGQASPNTSGAGCPTGASPATGITSNQIKLGIALVSLAGSVGNAAFQVPSPQVQQADFAAVIDSINKSGGVQCRQLAATYYPSNPIDQSSEHAVCLLSLIHI